MNAMSLFKLFKSSEIDCKTGVRPAFIFNCHFTVCANGVRPAYLTTTTNNNNNNDRNQDDFRKDLRADETFGSCVHVCAHRELNSLPAPDHFLQILPSGGAGVVPSEDCGSLLVSTAVASSTSLSQSYGATAESQLGSGGTTVIGRLLENDSLLGKVPAKRVSLLPPLTARHDPKPKGKDLKKARHDPKPKGKDRKELHRLPQ